MKNLGRYNNDLSIPRKKDVDVKQDKITASGILQGDGSGNVTAAETTDGSTMDIPSGLLKGSNGAFTQATAGTDYMPPVPVTTSDNGKFLRVVNGAWAKASISNANGGRF